MRISETKNGHQTDNLKRKEMSTWSEKAVSIMMIENGACRHSLSLTAHILLVAFVRHLASIIAHHGIDVSRFLGTMESVSKEFLIDSSDRLDYS